VSGNLCLFQHVFNISCVRPDLSGGNGYPIHSPYDEVNSVSRATSIHQSSLVAGSIVNDCPRVVFISSRVPAAEVCLAQ